MTERTVARRPHQGGVGVRYRPMYARALGLRHLRPGGMLCFVYFEGAISLSLLLALAELVSWWVVLILPASIAVMVKVNDLVAGAVARSAARTPERERERLRREVSAFMPIVGRAAVVTQSREATGQDAASAATGTQADPAVVGQQAGSHDDLPTSGEHHQFAVGADAAAAGAMASQDTQPAATGRHGEATGAGQPADAQQAATHAKPATGEERGQHLDRATAGSRETVGQYAAAGRYLDDAWRQHAYAMAHHADHPDQATQRERQSASRRYE
jgi:hypothetical protein